jgi:hypothetical protein
MKLRFLMLCVVVVLGVCSLFSLGNRNRIDANRVFAEIPFKVPSTVTDSLTEIASQCDILTLGETHGTQEVPAVARALLAPLSELGYDVLAVEISKSEQEPLVAWATGKTATVPESFSQPSPDGRVNIQLLSLIRVALSPPFRWKLICFDMSMSDFLVEMEELKHKSDQGNDKPKTSSNELSDDDVAFSKKRDAAMASNLTIQLQQLTPRPKVLAICGSLHNRIENIDDSWSKRLWPSFAAVLQRDNDSLKIGTINIRFHGGGFFNGGKVNKFPAQETDQANVRPAIEAGYHWELNLPHATPATFLSPPVVVQ